MHVAQENTNKNTKASIKNIDTHIGNLFKKLETKSSNGYEVNNVDNIKKNDI